MIGRCGCDQADDFLTNALGLLAVFSNQPDSPALAVSAAPGTRPIL
jgi:hypothetical protein